MASNRCLDILLFISLASFVTITLPIACVVITDYKATRNYVEGTCNGTTLTNYTVEGGFFFHGRVNVAAEVNGVQYNGYLYYPPIKHWQLAAMPSDGVDSWYYSLNKTGGFPCFVDLTDSSHPMIETWIEVIGYYIMLVMCLFIILGWSTLACVIKKSQKRHYIQIPDELPPPYTPNPNKYIYKSLNNQLITISV